MIRNSLVACTWIGLAIGLNLNSAHSSWAQENSNRVEIRESASRTWSSRDGRFSVEGQLVEVEGDKIRIQTSERMVTASLERLAEADRAFVKQELLRAQSAADNPFMADDASSEPNSSGGDGVAEANSGSPGNVEPDYTRASTVTLDSESPVDLTAERWQTRSRPAVANFRVPAFSIHSSVTGSASTPSENLFAISLFEPFGVDLKAGAGRNRAARGSGVKSWVELVDLPSGKSRGRFPLLAERSIVADIRSDGKQLLTYDGVFAQDPQLRAFTIDDSGLKLVSSLQLIDPDGRQQPAKSARFLAEGRLLVEFPQSLVVLDGQSWQPVYLVTHDAEDWQLASDRRHALVGQSGRRYEVDLVSGKCTGVVGEPGSVTPEGVVEPQGERVASIKDSVLTLRNSRGEIVEEFQVPVFWPNPTLSWLEDDFLRVDSPHQTHFIDLPRRIVLVEVSHSGGTAPNAAWSTEKATRGQNFEIVVSQITAPRQTEPDLQAYRQRITADAESLQILRPGDRVSLSLQLNANPQHAGLIEQRLRDLLTARGVVIDPSASNQLRVTTAQRSEEIEYRRFGSPPWDAQGIEKVQVRAVDQQIEYVLAGQVVWRRGSATGPGFMLHMKEGESAQQAVDRQTGDGTHFWTSLSFPRQICRHPNGQAWFRLTKTASGFVEQK